MKRRTKEQKIMHFDLNSWGKIEWTRRLPYVTWNFSLDNSGHKSPPNSTSPAQTAFCQHEKKFPEGWRVLWWWARNWLRMKISSWPFDIEHQWSCYTTLEQSNFTYDCLLIRCKPRNSQWRQITYQALVSVIPLHRTACAALSIHLAVATW